MPEKDHGGVINQLIVGSWKHPGTGKNVSIDMKSIVIKDSLAGMEGDLISALHPGEKLGVVSDGFTHDILGRRVARALTLSGLTVESIVWKNPRSTNKGVEQLRDLTRHCDGLIAIGSGTINDSVKYAAFLDQKSYSVFPTSPQNAYTTPTASITFDGFKKSITCLPARGVFFDLAVIANCPLRLTQSAVADVICRTTAQVDWLMSHLLFDTVYQTLPFLLLIDDEAALFKQMALLKAGDLEAFGTLVRICALMGLGTNFAKTTHSGSMGEHMISHYIDMFAGDRHPGSLHGEQVGVATVTMSRLQNQILNKDTPPVLSPTKIDEKAMLARYGDTIGSDCIEQFKRKSLNSTAIDNLNRQLDQHWNEIAGKLREVMLPFKQIETAMATIGAKQTAAALGLPTDFYQEAVQYSRQIRDRFTMLDLADDAGLLEDFIHRTDEPAPMEKSDG
jgi:glycerol-1-phosphate dehydrogenase [NAD(P)+]